MLPNLSVNDPTFKDIMADNIRLTDDEIRTGISLEIQAAEANARLRAIQDAAHVFAVQMRNKYKVDDSYQMTDWISGFVKAGTE